MWPEAVDKWEDALKLREIATGDTSPYRLSSPIQKRAIDASIGRTLLLFLKIVYDKQVCVLYLAKLVQDLGQAIKDRFYKEEEAALAAATTDEQHSDYDSDDSVYSIFTDVEFIDAQDDSLSEFSGYDDVQPEDEEYEDFDFLPSESGDFNIDSFQNMIDGL
ncbi:hypothetical protein D8674_022901 [Pyrus ussuriensis x Pyrus communis]|uniref:Uncharacterized protein n=1 Tax=Pyrus ussuriensis x Pyrus communis TaxID=2448454 RepID=A0A5N5GNF8_9ROSA|nr:hypothetical protein D8674_022901 [Pyrus ussuriensis x Pyrus communis]